MSMEIQLGETILDEKLNILMEEIEDQEINEFLDIAVGAVAFTIGATLSLLLQSIQKQIRIYKLIKDETNDTKRKNLKAELNKETVYEISLRKKILDLEKKTQKSEKKIENVKTIEKEKKKIEKQIKEIIHIEGLRKIAAEYRETGKEYKKEKRKLKQRFKEKRGELSWTHLKKSLRISEQKYTPTFEEFNFMNEVDDLVDDINNVEQKIWKSKNSKATSDWDSYSENVLSDNDAEFWDDVEPSKLKDVLDYAEGLVKKYKI